MVCFCADSNSGRSEPDDDGGPELQCCAPIWPNLESGASRRERDDLSFDMLRMAYTELGKAVREHDRKRLIFTVDSLPRPAAWHMEREGTWTPDNERQFRQMLRSLKHDPIDAISVHAYGEDTARVAWAVRAAKSLKKPLFTGEFGVPGTGQEVEEEFRRMHQIIEESPIPVAAAWGFDLPSQNADYNITADNTPSY